MDSLSRKSFLRQLGLAGLGTAAAGAGLAGPAAHVGLNTIGKECQQAGIQLGYRNHSFEFGMPEDTGRGVIDFKRILSLNKQAGIRHYFVERDYPPNPMKTMKDAYALSFKARTGPVTLANRNQ